MPDPNERHGRNSWEWGGQPSRSQQRAAAAGDDPNPAKRTHGKHDPDLCKGMHWKAPHQPALRQFSWGTRRSTCGWTIFWSRSDYTDPEWWCGHQEYCSACGKILQNRISPSSCPSRRPITKAEQAALEVQRQENLARLARWRYAPRKPPITGKQSYRKPKKEKK